ncbi:hypothetical protein Lal_00040472, partial [Lupinus albus]
LSVIQVSWEKAGLRELFRSLIVSGIRVLTSTSVGGAGNEHFCGGECSGSLGDCENEQWESFDVIEMYKSCLRGPHYFVLVELTKAGSLTVESRILHYVIAYILVERNTNHE